VQKQQIRRADRGDSLQKGLQIQGSIEKKMLEETGNLRVISELW
jgi:hypothetical protein